MPKTIPSDSHNLRRLNPKAAAIDIGATMHMAAVDPDADDMPIRAFGTFTHDLHDLHDLAICFKSCGVTSVAMESTGVYWIPAYEILEQHGFEVILVNARYAKNVPGRKTDVMACFGEAFGRMHRLPPCVHICGNGKGWSNMPPLISNTCRRRRRR